MGRKKKKIITLTIEDYAAEGKGIGFYEGKAVFVPDAVPGDSGEVILRRNRTSFAEGKWIELLQPSPIRIEPFCKHFDLCGGCKWQFVPYAKQLEFKEQEVVQNIRRIGKQDGFVTHPIVGSEKIRHYRNKLEFTFSDSRWLEQDEVESGQDIDRRGVGFHIPGKFDRIVDIQECFLMDDWQNTLRNTIRKYALEHDLSFYNVGEHTGLLRNLMVRLTETGQKMVLFQFGEPEMDKIEGILKFTKDTFTEITSLYYVVNEKKNDTFLDQEVICYHGTEKITEKLTLSDGTSCEFYISPKSFFQTNTLQAQQLYDLAIQKAGLTGAETVYDLYCGTGTISAFLAKKSKKTIGIEYVEDAVVDSRENMALNSVNNAEFFAGDLKEVLTEDFYQQHGYPDVLVTDPPRAGMHQDVVEVIKKSGANKIVYVSCNSATQARDIQWLSDTYILEEIQPVDMFPHTHHIENIAVLTKK